MKGILMTPENHQMIRQGLKTQTRRLDNLEEINHESDRWVNVHPVPKERLLHTPYEGLWVFHDNDGNNQGVESKYRIGETIYIEEVYRFSFAWEKTKTRDIPPSTRVYYKDSETDIPLERWRPPMFMPEWAARTFIKITDVRPERLKDITEEDAKAEGIMLKGIITQGRQVIDGPNYINTFAMLWDSINGKTHPFDGSFWVWRICFNLTD